MSKVISWNIEGFRGLKSDMYTGKHKIAKQPVGTVPSFDDVQKTQFKTVSRKHGRKVDQSHIPER